MSLNDMVREEVGLIRRMFANGGKWLLLANMYFVASLTIFAIALIVTQCNQPSAFAPMEFHNPAKILAVEGNLVTATIERCNKQDEDIAVEGSYSVRNVVNGALIKQGEGRANVWVPGCTIIAPTIALVAVPPGRYELVGATVARSEHNQTQVAAWRSEEFTIEGSDD
jgi:hypothetical protein